MKLDRRSLMAALGVSAAAATTACAAEDEAQARRQRSIAAIKALGAPTLDSLPMIERSDEVKIRKGPAVARRLMCLVAVAQAAIEGDPALGWKKLDAWGVRGDLTPSEKRFLSPGGGSERARIEMSWRFEAMVPLMWALGQIDTLPTPLSPYDAAELVDYWAKVPKGFDVSARTRPVGELLDQADLIYRLHWAVRDAQLNDRPSPAGLDADVVVERHHALNWLIGYGDEEWDEVTTDT